MAFQIIDDILDYTKESQEIGKPVLEDMRQGVYSLPLIYSLQKQTKATTLFREESGNDRRRCRRRTQNR